MLLHRIVRLARSRRGTVLLTAITIAQTPEGCGPVPPEPNPPNRPQQPRAITEHGCTSAVGSPYDVRIRQDPHRQALVLEWRRQFPTPGTYRLDRRSQSDPTWRTIGDRFAATAWADGGGLRHAGGPPQWLNSGETYEYRVGAYQYNGGLAFTCYTIYMRAP